MLALSEPSCPGLPGKIPSPAILPCLSVCARAHACGRPRRSCEVHRPEAWGCDRTGTGQSPSSCHITKGSEHQFLLASTSCLAIEKKNYKTTKRQKTVCHNMHNGIPKKEERQKKCLQNQIMAENFPNLMKDTHLCIQAVYARRPTPGPFTVQLLGPGARGDLGSSREVASWTRSLREANSRPLAGSCGARRQRGAVLKALEGKCRQREFRFWQKYPSEENSGHSRTNRS